MKANVMAIVFEAEKLPKQEAEARAQVWAKATQLLVPGLGKLYSKFYPTARAWGKPVGDPFGVVLGAQTPEKLLTFYVEAHDAQRRAIEFHLTPILGGLDPEKVVRAGDALICPVTVDMNDDGIKAHALWHLAVMGGAPVPDCGLYYADRNSAVITPDEERSIIGNAAGYAMCLVAVEPVEAKHDGTV